MRPYTQSTLSDEMGTLAEPAKRIGKTEGSGDITVDTSISTNSTNPVQNKAIATALQQAQGKLDGKADKETVVTVSGSTVDIAPEDNHDYQCGELASLTITSPTAEGSYSIEFTSGSTPTVAVLPPKPAMRWQTADNEPPQGFPAANTRYEINVKNTYVTMGEWPVPEGSE